MTLWNVVARVTGLKKRKRERAARIKIAMARADAFRDAGDFASAAEAYEQLTVANPKHRGAWGQLGNMRKDLGQYSDAELAYGRLLALAPANIDARIGMGHLKKLQRDYVEAKFWFEAVLTLEPGNHHAIAELDLVTRAENDDGRGSAHTLDLPPAALMMHRRLAISLKNRRA